MANYQEIYIDQGTFFQSRIPVIGKSGLPLDLTGYSARGSIKKHWTSKKSITFIAEILVPETAGEILIGLAPEQTTAIKPGRYWYDIEIYTGSSFDLPYGNILRIAEGQVIITPRVTVDDSEPYQPPIDPDPYEDLTDDGWFYE